MSQPPNKRRKLAAKGGVNRTLGEPDLPLSKPAKCLRDECDKGAVSSAEWQEGCMLDWMLRPCTTHQFIKQHLDQRPLHISRHKHQHYFDGLLTKADIQQLLNSQQLQYGTNVDVTSYTNGQRTNLNFNGSESTDQLETADASTVLRRFNKESCSVRVLHPQRWVEPVYKLLSMLEDELRSPVGCNAYLTPPSSQGFAPHWDDIDAFVLQVEGSKRWRLYAPDDNADLLPRDSSRDFQEEELGKLLLDVTLHPGDLLYMPRGCIHQAQALPDAHSLHLTVSANQHCSWTDLFELSLPRALQLAGDECIELRRSLPLDMSQYMGLIHEEEESAQRNHFTTTAQQMLQQVTRHMPLDAAADRMSVQFVQQRLPPYGLHRRDERPDLEVSESSKITLVRPGIAAMTIEDDNVVLYHCLNNPRILHASHPNDLAKDESEDEQPDIAPGRLEFDVDYGEVLERILSAHGSKGISVGKLQMMLDDTDSTVDLFALVGDLYSEGLVDVQP